MIGAIVGFKNFLHVRGVGYKFELSFNNIFIQAGYSHLLKIKLPSFQALSFNKKNTVLRIKSQD